MANGAIQTRAKNLFKQAFTGICLAAVLLVPAARAQNQDVAKRQKTAIAMFNERCKTAGEFIHRTADDVEAVLLMKVRPPDINYGDQYKLDDPYGRDLAGDGGYVWSFLKGSYEAGAGKPVAPAESTRGYSYVEAIDPDDGVRYRYKGSKKVVGRMDANAPNIKLALRRNPDFDLNIYAFVVKRVPATGPAPRYGVTYDDISTREERDYWIAGSSLKVIDIQTSEVMAERIGYMVDVSQGSRAGGRSPWLFAADHACPPFPAGSIGQRRQTQQFVQRILRPRD